MKPLTSKENKSRLKKTNCHIYQEEIRATLFMVKLKNMSLYRQILRRWIPNLEVPGSKPLGGSKVDSAFHSSEVDQLSNKTSWGLSGKK